MSVPTASADVELSPECIVGRQRGYGDLHAKCRQAKDIPLPYGGGLLLQRRCECVCHRYRKGDGS